MTTRIVTCSNGHSTEVSGDTIRFCRRCGIRLEESRQQLAEAPTPTAAESPLLTRPLLPQNHVTKKPRRWWPISTGAIAFLCLAAVGAFMLTQRPHHQPRSTSTFSTAVRSSTRSTNSATTSSSQNQATSAKQEAQAIDRVLEESATNFNLVTRATNDIAQCGNLSNDAQVLNQVSANRQKLANQANQMDVGQLTNGLTLQQELATAMEDSAGADTDYANWAVNNQGNCQWQSGYDDPGLQSDDKQSTADKQTFLNDWNPVAAQYGLKQWAVDEF